MWYSMYHISTGTRGKSSEKKKKNCDFKNSKHKNGFSCEVLGCLSNFNLQKNIFLLNFGIFKNSLVTDDVTVSGKMENARNNNVKYKILVNEHLNQFIFPLSFN